MVDRMTRAKRSALMASIRSKDTGPERALRSELHRQGRRFFKHVAALPGKPDIVFPKHRVAVFVDGDFWHGYRFGRFAHKLSPYWHEKIAGNRVRDRRNFARLRRRGWIVIRIWEHDIKSDLLGCAERVNGALTSQRERAPR